MKLAHYGERKIVRLETDFDDSEVSDWFGAPASVESFQMIGEDKCKLVLVHDEQDGSSVFVNAEREVIEWKKVFVARVPDFGTTSVESCGVFDDKMVIVCRTDVKKKKRHRVKTPTVSPVVDKPMDPRIETFLRLVMQGSDEALASAASRLLPVDPLVLHARAIYAFEIDKGVAAPSPPLTGDAVRNGHVDHTPAMRAIVAALKTKE